MTSSIRIHEPQARPDDPRRLNAFAGRSLGEREFEELQAYVDRRIAPLLATLSPGVIEGLELAVTGSGAAASLRVRPGLAVGANGRLVRLFYPLDQDWSELLAEAERQADASLRDGLYLVTLATAVEEIDAGTEEQACTRTEPDPLRDRRIETVTLLGLQFVTASPRILAMPQARAANRMCVRFLRESPFDAATGTVPIGLVKVAGRQPEWFDLLAGRFLAEADAAAHTLLAHTLAVMDDWQGRLRRRPTITRAAPGRLRPTGRETIIRGDAIPSLPDLLGIDYLPAAGPFPAALVSDLAGNPPQLGFQPLDLQVEMAPVPASTVEAVIAAELGRGRVDLVHGLSERIRLLLAVPDLDYRHDLFDLPQRDAALEDELFRRAQAASEAWQRRNQQWNVLFHGLAAGQLRQFQAPPLPVVPPREPLQYRNDLVERRAASLGQGEELPEPYASHLAAPNPPPAGYSPPAAAGGDIGPGLYRQEQDLRDEIAGLESALDQSYRLLNEVNDFLGLQRQQLDSLAVSFSALAGGVAGDGLGLGMVRWTTKAQFMPKAADAASGGNT